ncbi:MAG: Porphobilinogen deaminase [Chlamydiales bacterium]|nr:Porphobilinogen deaminase [Chlamydiales bacterium]
MLKKLSKPSSIKITVGARASALSKAQVKEVNGYLKAHFSHIQLTPVYVKTHGDHDQTTSLRTLNKTDFFTRAIDQMQLRGECRLSIHSAKDLPDPLPLGLKLAALTPCLNASDSLVLKQGTALPSKGVVATSSPNREKAVRTLFPNAQFVDIRGTIEQRIAKLQQEQLDGVVIAEAALMRLGLTHLSRLTLPGKTTPLQGSLAILAKEEDLEMLELFGTLFAVKNNSCDQRSDG